MNDHKQHIKEKRPVTRRQTGLRRTSGNHRRPGNRRQQIMKYRLLIAAAVVVLIVMVVILAKSCGRKQEPDPELLDGHIDVQLLTPNPYSRPQIPVEKVNNIVVHYLANPGSIAQDNRDWFESLKDSGETYISSNFLVGLDGEIIQCVPTNEVAYASNDRNGDTVSIECCHPDESGKLNKETYKSLVWLTAYLCNKFDLTGQDVIRHYDVTGKICPKWAVDDPKAWEDFKDDVDKEIKRQLKEGY